MSVEYIKGNLLDFPAGINVIGHCANCQCTLGNGTATGIAKAIGERYPAAAAADKEAFNAGMAQLGYISNADLGDGKKIANIYGQFRFGNDRRHLDYEAFNVALTLLRDLLQEAHKEGRIYTLGLPYKVGCNRAGGDWRVVDAMIHTLFDDSPVRCVVVELENEPNN